MKLQIKVDDDGNITESVFKTFGCGSAIAASSVATEWVKGKSVDEALSLKNSDIASHLKLPPVKLHCSMLAEDAIKAAVKDWKSKQEEEKPKATAVWEKGLVIAIKTWWRISGDACVVQTTIAWLVTFGGWKTIASYIIIQLYLYKKEK